MAFTDDFTGTSGQLLGSRPGWALGAGTDTLTISSSNQLSRSGNGVVPTVYYRTDDGSTNQIAGCDFLGTVGTSWGPVIFASGSDLASLNGYWMRPQTGGTSARVYRIDNGVQTLVLTASGLADCLQLELRGAVVAGNVQLAVWSHGVQVSTFTDSSASKKTSGQRGLFCNVTGSLFSSPIDNYYDNYVSGQSLFLNERVSRFFEGIRNTTPSVFLTGTYTTAPATIQARLEDASGNAVAGFDWSTKVASPTGGTFTVTFANVPVGGPYTVAIRDSALPATVVRNVNGVYVGAIIMPWGQSQNSKLGSDFLGTLAATPGMKVFYSCSPNRAIKDAANALKDVSAQYSTIGSGIVAWANQWHADTGGAVPLLIQDCTVPGTGINSWVNDLHDDSLGSSDPTYKLWSNYANQAFIACDRQASAIMWMQGTNDVGNYSTYGAAMDQLRDKFLAALPSQTPLFCVTPHQRTNDTNQTWNMRSVQYQKAISGGTWRLCTWLLDWEMGSDASPHQSGNPAGNPRGGTRIARGMAKLLVNAALDAVGPQVISVKFVDATRTAIDILFDKDISAADGSTTTGIQGFFVSTDNSTYTWTPSAMTWTSAIVGPRTVRVTSTAGAFPYGTTRIDLHRGYPFSSDTTSAYYFGPEANMEVNAFSKVITDTSSFDNNRGLPAAPIMGLGKAVALPLTINANSYSTTLNVAQA